MKKIICLLLGVLLITACVSKVEYPRTGQPVWTYEDRVLSFEKEKADFKKYKSGNSLAWTIMRETTIAIQDKGLYCEQAYLEDRPTVENACKNYDFPSLREKTTNVGMDDSIYSAMMRAYYTAALFRKNKTKEAEAELKSFDDFYNSHRSGCCNKPIAMWTMLDNATVQQLRIEVISKYIDYLTLNKRTEEAGTWIKNQEQYIASLDALKLNWKYEDKVYEERHDLIKWAREEASHNDFLAEMEKRDREKAEYEKNNPGASYNALGSQSTQTAGTGSCTCIKREQYWVMGSSASGIVKARPGRHEYRDVKVPCPCN